MSEGDISAIITVANLGMTTSIFELGKSITVGQGTVALLRSLGADQINFAADGGVMAATEDGFSFVEDSAEEKRKRGENFLQLASLYESSARVVPVMQMLSLEREKRQQLEQIFGIHGTESMLLATSPGYVLWTDDFTVGALGSHEYGIRRVWTQAVLQWAAQSGVMPAELYFEHTAKLVGWSYHFTSINAASLISAGRLAEWKPDHWPLKKLLDQFKSVAVDFKSTLNLTLLAIVELHKSEELIARSDATIIKILDNVAESKDGVLAIEAIHRAIPKIFAVNPIGKDAAEARLAHWLASYKSRGHIIINP